MWQKFILHRSILEILEFIIQLSCYKADLPKKLAEMCTQVIVSNQTSSDIK